MLANYERMKNSHLKRLWSDRSSHNKRMKTGIFLYDPYTPSVGWYKERADGEDCFLVYYWTSEMGGY